MGKTEEAFNFYKSVFGTEFVTDLGAPITRMKDFADPSQPALPEDEQDKVMHVQLPILGGHVIMGTDMLESMGHTLTLGNNMSINLEPDTRAETEKLYASLSMGADAKECMPLQDMPWGGYFGTCQDKFGIRWMFNCGEQKAE
jgi:PhnB protein